MVEVSRRVRRVGVVWKERGEFFEDLGEYEL